MPELLTYQIIPYLRLGLNADPYLKPGPEWVRDVVKGLMHKNDQKLKAQKVDTSLFHNHDETNSRNKIEYPRIIYHFAHSRFLVTGINEGAYALELLMRMYEHPVEAEHDLLVSFRRFSSWTKFEIVPASSARTYRLSNYLPFNARVHKEYVKMNARDKIVLLEKTITKHLLNDMFKYLEIPIFDPDVRVLDILKLDQKRHTYKEHHFLSFDLLFESCASLPDLLTLGNGKAFGYGLIENCINPAVEY